MGGGASRDECGTWEDEEGMTDLELLGLAAKAAGLTLGPEWNLMNDGILVNGTGCGDGFYWRPLTDDGDALRLAVKLNLWEAVKMAHRLLGEPECPDMYAATRRAIVRAAAEIGKAL